MRNTVVPTKESSRAPLMTGDDPSLQENASAKFARKRAEAKAAADALNGRRADTTTPLDTLGRAPLDTIPEPPTAPTKPARSFHFSTEIAYKGRVITVHAEGMTLSEFSALLDAHGFVSAEVAS